MNSTPPPVSSPELASLDRDLGSDGASVVRSLAALLRDEGRVSDLDVFVDAVMAREALGSTVLPGGIAMPHARSHAAIAPSVAVARLPEPVSFSSGSAPVRLVLLIAAPGDDSPGYLALLQKIATACVKQAFVSDLSEARTTEALADLVGTAVAKR
ncbi:PTS sugar transporter subunit IIA [Nocardioides sp. YIM 152315]|uniref:PTS sugar transporter subunit IIA n=1 Tax=Nocardioides sp. YIM 152315 TaxID=3031760 RepID=UPI0023DBCC64|nr:PTS sugar transporter subunit IIA [Nocardioides sp. YIM 152315]MDF1606235.1 PTS sugar transporter subunit IIA [Nocardioides sp. YIM 152315]